MGYDVYCPFCKQYLDDNGEWEGYCPICGREWHREECCDEDGNCSWDNIWKDQDL